MKKAIERLHYALMYSLVYHIKNGDIKELVDQPYSYLSGFYRGSISDICYLILLQHGVDEEIKARREYYMMVWGH